MALYQKIYRLFVEPRPYTTYTQGEKWLMAEGVTEKYLLGYGKKKRAEQIAKGSKNPVAENYYLNKRLRYMKYVNFKIDVKREAQRVLYMPMMGNIWVKYYFPMPESWSQKKKNKHAWEKHESKPDRGNCDKALSDAFWKEDKMDWDGRSSKFWTPASKGYIEIEVGTLSPAKPNLFSITSLSDELK